MITTLYCKNDNGDLSPFKNIRIPDFVWTALWEHGDCPMNYTEPLPNSSSFHPVASIDVNETATMYQVLLKPVIDHHRSIIGCACDGDGKFLEHVRAGWFN